MGSLTRTNSLIRLTGLKDSIQIEKLKIEACLNDETAFKEIQLPVKTLKLCPNDFIPGHVARMYQGMYQDLVNDTFKSPDFTYAVELHRLIDRTEKASII